MATVSIEASKECQVFARRTAELSALVKEGYPGASIVVNAERPRKGHFEVRVGEKVILTLAGMPRPFKRLRETELSEVATAIVAALRGGGDAKEAPVAASPAPAGAAKAPAKKAAPKAKKAAPAAKSEPAESEPAAAAPAPPLAGRKRTRA